MLFWAALGAPLIAGPGANGPGADFLANVHPDQAEGRAVLAKCAQAGLSGEYYYEFELQVLPRRAPERTIEGRLWGGRNERGLIWRIELDKEGGGERRWLVQGGPSPAAWMSDNGRPAMPAGPFDPLAPGVQLTPFDLEFPPSYLYWPDETLAGMFRVLGRPAYVFILRPPEDFAARYPSIGGVRTRLDAEYDVPVETEILGADGTTLKTLSLVDLKKVGGDWIVKEVDARDEKSRDKTRLDVTGAATNLDFSPELFSREALSDPVAPPPDERIARFGP